MDKKSIHYNEFIRKLSVASGFTQSSIKDLLPYIDEVICESLSDASEDESVEVRITPSIGIRRYYKKPMNRVNPSTKEPIVTDGKFKTVGRVYGRVKHS